MQETEPLVDRTTNQIKGKGNNESGYADRRYVDSPLIRSVFSRF